MAEPTPVTPIDNPEVAKTEVPMEQPQETKAEAPVTTDPTPAVDVASDAAQVDKSLMEPVTAQEARQQLDNTPLPEENAVQASPAAKKKLSPLTIIVGLAIILAAIAVAVWMATS